MGSARLTGRELKRILGVELSNDPFGAALERIGRIPPTQAVSPLFGFFCSRDPLVRWRWHANLLFSNWLNYYVYQLTPYDVSQIPQGGTLAGFG